ncbi:ABC transporter ATP-binding protein [Couchioplanes azureus]|uniref:ABC transporter ATP-binding protein n=1 Tax=Couchioplanes caeruleus TaxID=56438 RepID=UPI0019BE3E7F|nr:ABC transporter ATP-binding protein [Couchioplanes caeruleus]GGQ75151.1 multidrug ABC transporter permease [Couchioplanes caeruleus subsp. azureus]
MANHRKRAALLRAVALVRRAAPASLVLSLVVSVAAAAVPVAVAWLTKVVLDGVSRGSGGPALRTTAVLLAIASAMVLILPELLQYLRARLSRAASALAQDRLLAAVLRLPGLAPFENPAFLDRLRLARQAAGSAPDATVDGAVGLLRSMLVVGGFVGSLAVLSPVMTLVVAAAALPALWAQLALAGHRATAMARMTPVVRREIFYGELLLDVQAAKEIRLFGTGRFLRSRVRRLRADTDARHRRMDRADLLTQGGLTLLAAAIAGGGLVWAVLAAGSGRLTVGDVSMFVAAVAGVQGGLAGAVRDLGSTRQHLLLFRHYLDVVDAEPGPEPPAAAAPPALRHGIELHDVWFRYADDHPWILRGVDLFIPAGAAVALVGQNGAGKSTLVKLLCRLYEPTRGRILWDGVDVRDIPVAALRERMSAVFQDFMRYDLSARENIALGDLDALDDPQRIRRAARRAGVDRTVAGLPRGYDTLLTRSFFDGSDGGDPDPGVVLSGGQWQRLALARAMLRDGRDLLILDEPSAGLDPAAEHEIHVGLRAHRQGRTSLLISHRLGVLRDADRIVVLADGRIAEQGRHDELVAAGGRYAELFRLQAGPYRDGEPALPARGPRR